MNEFPIKIETIQIKQDGRKLKPGWKSWYCKKCGDGFLYRGKRPKHKNCKGKLTIVSMISPESEQELIECMAAEIRKETKNHES